jgi:16S rRNA (cytidine1402-2'-O)-methyltransferase
MLLADESRTIILYESPHKLLKTLGQLVEYFGADRGISVSRELSKLHEETVRGTTTEVLKYFEAKPPKGEIVIVIGGKK